MSKYAVISDIHANIDALNLVLKDAEKRNVDKIICLGDLVVKYFHPAEVVDAVKSNADIVVKGNCDNLVATDERYKFARSKLGLSRIEYLDNLPTSEQLIIKKTILNFYHSSPNSLDAMFNPLFDNSHTRYKDFEIKDYNKMFTSNTPQISIVGHTHVPFIAENKGKELNVLNTNETIIHPQDRKIINVGSVGEPAHLEQVNKSFNTVIEPYLTYLIIDTNQKDDTLSAEIIKIPYKDTLKNVYFNMLDMQKNHLVPPQPNDTAKVYNSLINMGYTDDDLKKGR